MHEPATLLVQMFRFEKENLEGEDVAALATATRVLHEDLEARGELLATLLEPRPAGAARPRGAGGEHASLC
jgi:hypothetical protein